MKKEVDVFIKEHTHINYCEAIVDTDGFIKYATPSHVESLIKETGLSRDEIYDLMDITSSPIHWLVDYTSCACIYTNGIIVPRTLTQQQINTIAKLTRARLTTGEEFKF